MTKVSSNLRSSCSTPEGVRRCQDPACGRVLSRRSDLRRHENDCHKPPLSCTVQGCDVTVKRRYLLQRHLAQMHGLTESATRFNLYVPDDFPGLPETAASACTAANKTNQRALRFVVLPLENFTVQPIAVTSNWLHPARGIATIRALDGQHYVAIAMLARADYVWLLQHVTIVVSTQDHIAWFASDGLLYYGTTRYFDQPYVLGTPSVWDPMPSTENQDQMPMAAEDPSSAHDQELKQEDGAGPSGHQPGPPDVC